MTAGGKILYYCQRKCYYNFNSFYVFFFVEKKRNTVNDVPLFMYYVCLDYICDLVALFSSA